MIQSPINTSNRQAMEDAFNALEEKLNADVFVYYGELIDGVEAESNRLLSKFAKRIKSIGHYMSF